MPIFPGAIWRPISGPSGAPLGGPAKIVHHTTEGSSASGAFAAYAANRSDPHFTVDATTIWQHIDTAQSARALRNAAGGVQTNRDGAIQIEIVGFAHRPKTRATLVNVARLCRWIEAVHGVPRVWPNGYPRPATPAGTDPGGHTRTAAVWDRRGGHYGHSQVPENTHWDPAFTRAEVDFLMAWTGAESLDAPVPEGVAVSDPGVEAETSRMPDHAHGGDDLPERIESVRGRVPAGALDRVARAIVGGRLDPRPFGFAEGLGADPEAMLRAFPEGLEAIVRATDRPPLLVRGGAAAWTAIDDLPDLTRGVLDAIAPAIASVGRVEFINHPQTWGGTGFVVDAAPFGRRIVATNRHVAAIVARRVADGTGLFLRSDRHVAYGARVDFHEEIGAARGDASREVPVTAVRYLADEAEADLALLEIAVREGLMPDPIPLSGRRAREHELVATIGYPARADQRDVVAQALYFGEDLGVKRLSPGRILNSRPGEILSYDCTTLGGSSGSCLVSLETQAVLGVHYWGEEGSHNAAVSVETLKAVLARGSAVHPGAALPAGAEGAPEAAADRTTPAGALAGRNGYDPGFLGAGLEVPLPRLSAAHEADLARPDDGGGAELRYRNFSVLVSAGRRMARVTAVNIDGARSQRIKRREPDVWSVDARLPAGVQLASTAYEDPLIDRGHLVRREDPNWGPDAQQANDDTFHLTNAAPQHSTLNQSTRFWRGLEDHVLNSARTHGFRASVFSGPVLREGDEPLGRMEVGIPEEFWKVVVMPAAAGGLWATGYLVSQGHFLQELRAARGLPEAVEGFQFGPYRSFQVPIRLIEELAGLDFGPLRAADPMAQDGRAEAQGDVAWRVVEGVGDLLLDRPAARPVAEDPLARVAAALDARADGLPLARIVALEEALGQPAADAPGPAYPDDLLALFAGYHDAVAARADGHEAPAPALALRKDDYEALYASQRVRKAHEGEVAWIVGRLNRRRDRYAAVGDPLDIPWWFVGILHALEASLNFGTHLHNGDPLSARTVQVPKGRPATGAPPFSWETSARDALQLKRLANLPQWGVADALYRFEGYNGWGYFYRSLPSPYLWSFSQHYTRGKFVRDHTFDPAAVSRQCGAAVLMKALGVTA